MSSNNLINFLRALDNVKRDLTCGVCSELCQNPVTLSKCFHIICSEHFGTIKNCPSCNIALEDSRIFEEKHLESTVECTKQLNDIFQPYRSDAENRRPNTESSASKDVSSKKRVVKARQTSKKPSESNQSERAPSNTKETEVKGLTPKSSKLDQLNSSLHSTSGMKYNKVLEKKNNKGESQLHVACRLGKIDKVTELLQLGANTNTKDNAGWTPLHEVVQNNRLDLVKLLLQHNALINVPGQGNETPLHEAVRYGHRDIIKELIVNGADVTIRNIKGETPFDLASDSIKKLMDEASENIIQTQSLNITHMSVLYSELDNDDIKVYCASQYRTVLNKLKLLTKHHSNLSIEAKFTKKVTHIVVDTESNLICSSTLDVLHGIVNELWVVSSDWLTNSTVDTLEPFEKYEITGVGKNTHNGPKRARYNKYKQLPRLFNGCHFYLHNFNSNFEVSKHIVLNKSVLSKLIQDGGGVVLRRVPNPESIPESESLVPYHASKGGKLAECAHYIIFKDMYEPMYNMKHLKALPVAWLIECIEKFELCDP